MDRNIRLRVGVFFNNELIDATIAEVEITSHLDEVEIDWTKATLKIWEEYKDE